MMSIHLSFNELKTILFWIILSQQVILLLRLHIGLFNVLIVKLEKNVDKLSAD